LLVVTILVLTILVLKTTTTTLSSYVLGQPLRNSVQTGLYLSQVGEFSFILALAGKSQGLFTGTTYQMFLSASVVTMIATPFIIKASPTVSLWLVSRALSQRLERIRRISEYGPIPKRSGHVIIIGFGINGRNLARVLRESGIPYVVLELNNDTVRKMKKRGEPIYYGDGTSMEILHKLSIDTAKMLVIAISDAAATRRIVQIARNLNDSLYILVRTRYVAEVEDLLALGANEVIPEEFETSIEIFSRVLYHYNVPRNIINRYIDNVRKDSYRVLRNVALPRKRLSERHELLKGIETESYVIDHTSRVKGRSLKDIDLRAKTGATIIAVKRGETIYQNPPSDFVLNPGDIILVIGKDEDIKRAIEYIESAS